MEHILDNPVYNALISGNKKLANGHDGIRYFSKTVAPFISLKETTQEGFDELYEIIPFESQFAYVSPVEIEISRPWKMIDHMQVLQMTYDKKLERADQYPEIVNLNYAHVPQMMELVALTHPGPFGEDTIAFGNYQGIFQGNTLIAMAGFRLSPFEYTEISAVCTHPDFTGSGLARKLMLNHIYGIQQDSRIPFLHVKSENVRAAEIYLDLGFTTRKEMSIYTLEKL